MKIVVIGGTGLVGRQVVDVLRADGHEAVAASRATGVNVVTGVGLDGALAGADVVVDASNSEAPYGEPSYEFFALAARNLLDAEARAGVGHHVSISVVGSDRQRHSPYFRGKAAAEDLIRASGIPYTILHATQFYEFLLAIVEAGGVSDQALRLSPAYIQPVASTDVAEALARIAVNPPRNMTLEIAGPELERMSDIVQRFLSGLESPVEVVIDERAPYFGAVLEERSLVPCEAAHRCPVGFEAWLRESEYAKANW
ncbi:SDR family oxidoreductase [Luteibacter sp.]|uniref:SDR family oxidoreductase n=1 Tax=Luteibacter sp. TaxID=1886636 RepID=UPI003F7E6421